ncbi:MAG: M28 family peptidase [Planctomycetota bacterium]
MLLASWRIVILCLLLSTPLVHATEEGGALVLSGERVKEHIRYLAADAMEGRKSGTDGYRRAADWVAARFQEWGLSPAGENGSYFQEVTMGEFDWTTGVPRLSVGGREFPFDDEDFSLLDGSTIGARAEAEVVFVGYGISSPGKGLDEYAGLDVAGKIVLVLKGSPATAPEPRRYAPPGSAPEAKGASAEEWAEEAKDAVKIRTAYDKGATAILLYDPSPPADEGQRRSWRRRSAELDFEPERAFLAAAVQERVFRALLRQDAQESPRGLRTRLDSLRRAIRQKRVQSHPTGVHAVLAGYETRVHHSDKEGNNKARNVLAKIPGVDPVLKDEVVLVGAHLDHVGASNGYVYNGADDNASGSAVCMEVGRVLAESGFAPRRTVVFACWCGEEQGLLGSMHYTRHPCDGVSMERIVACFTLDMVGLGDTVRASGALNFPELWEVIKKDQDPEILKIVQASVGGPGGSDHSGFIVKGIETLFIITGGGEGHPDYHQPEDDAEKMDPEILRKTGQLVLQGVVNMASETEISLLVANRERIYQAVQMRISNFNPDLPDSSWSTVSLEAENREGLYGKLLDQALERIKKEGAKEPGEASALPARSIARGFSRLAALQGDLRLLQLIGELQGVSRVDVKGDDGFWVMNGRLTEAGRAAVKVIEEKGFVVRLERPSEALLGDFLAAASKPFVVTSPPALSDSMVDSIVEKGVLLGVDLDPQKVGEFIERLEALKNEVGKRDLLFVFLTATDGLEEAKKPLYLGLLEKGWAPREIGGTRRRSEGLMGGNVRALERSARE